MKYVLTVGGTMSGIGKGVTTSSIGAVLKSSGVKVTAIKIDPYYNVDAGLLSPYEHGEVFVLNDGCEVDLDLGNYERFLDTDLCSSNNITTGKINQQVILKERQGVYQGATVRYDPHVTDEIRDCIRATAEAQGAEVCLIELGGTIGDFEVMPYIEALRGLKIEVGRGNFVCCLVNPVLSVSGELKTKPVQQAVHQFGQYCMTPDVIACRGDRPINDAARRKISRYCGVPMDRVLDLPDAKTIYSVPIELERQGILRILSEALEMEFESRNLDRWAKLSEIAVNSKQVVHIALVGKYTNLIDCYTSVNKALEHACYHVNARPKISYIESSLLEDSDASAWNDLKIADCLIVPGGFGHRGTEGKIKAIEWARKNKLPFLGICLGFQMAAVEYSRNVLGYKNAQSAEFDADIPKRPYESIVIEMLDYVDPERKMGGTQRLGLKKTLFVTENSILRRLYDGQREIEERHRHRYEINPEYIGALEKEGLKFVGKNDDGTRMEVLELDEKEHPYYVAVQFHPEYRTRPFRPSPPYVGLIEAAIRRINA